MNYHGHIYGQENERRKMQSDTGHIYYQDDAKIANLKGELVPWEVGEIVEVKGCRFKVKEIKVFPEDEITLVGIAKPIDEGLKTLSELVPEVEFTDKTYHEGLRDFLGNK